MSLPDLPVEGDKHWEVYQEYLKGAEIQFHVPADIAGALEVGWLNCSDMDEEPEWWPLLEYRVKPEEGK
jgi:hypothetical protein